MPDGSFETTFPCISNSLCIGNGSKALEIIGQCSTSHREASNFPIGKRSEPRTLVGWGGRWRGDLTTEIVANEIKSDLKSVSVLETAQKHCEHRPVLEVPPGSLRSGFMIHRTHHHQPHPTTTTTTSVSTSLSNIIFTIDCGGGGMGLLLCEE